MTATLISRMTKNVKMEIPAALAQINLDGYTVNAANLTVTCDEDTDGSFYGIWFYRSGEEVIAVPDFYINEGHSQHRGSQGGEYELNGETLTEE